MHFVYARVKEKELERSKNSDGVLLFFVPSSHREEFIFITQFSFFVCLFFLFERQAAREVSNFCVKAWGETNKFYLSL